MTRFSGRGFRKRVILSVTLLFVSLCVGLSISVWNILYPHKYCPATPKVFDDNPLIANNPLQFPIDPNRFEPISVANADRLEQLAIVQHVPDGSNGRGVSGTATAFSPDSTVLAIFGNQDIDWHEAADERCATVWLWHLSSPQGRIVVLKSSRDTYSERLIGFSPQSNMLLTEISNNCQRDTDCYELWNVTTGRLIRAFGYAEFVHFPDRDIVSFHDYNAFGRRLWDITNRHEVRDVPPDSALISARLFSPDGKLFVTTSADAVISVYQTETQQKVAELHGHVDEDGIDNIERFLFSQDSNWLVSQGSDTRVWNVHTGQQRLLLNVGRSDFYGRQLDFDFSPGSHMFRLQTDFWNVESETLIERLPMNSNSRTFLGLNVDRTVFITGSNARWHMTFSMPAKSYEQTNSVNFIEILNAKTGGVLSYRAVNGNVPSLAFSPDGRFIAVLVDKSWDYGLESHVELWGIPRRR